MRNLITISLFLFLLATTSIAHHAIDSLEALLPETADTTKLNILNDLSFEYRNVSTSDAINYGVKALELAAKLENKEGEAEARKNIGVGLSNMFEYDKALRYYDEAKAIYEKINNRKGIANILNNIGVVYVETDRYDIALGYYLDAMNIYEAINDTGGIASSLINIGIIYNVLGENDLALEKYKESLRLFQLLGDCRGAAICLNNLGNIYSDNKDFNKALLHYMECLELNTKSENKFGIGDALLNIGYVYHDMKEFDTALEYYLKAYAIEMELKDTYGLAITTNNLGDLFRELKNYDESLRYLSQSLKYSSEINARDMLIENYNCLAKLFAEKEDYKKAFEYYKLHHVMKDSIFNEQSSGTIAEMQAKYDAEKKDRENELLRKESAMQSAILDRQVMITNSIGLGACLILVIALIMIRAYGNKRKANVQLNDQKHQIENQAAELKTANDKLIDLDRFKEAMTGMIVHDLKNPLGAIINYSQNKENLSQSIIHQAGLGMLNMVTNILDVQKFEDSKMHLDKTDINLRQIAVNAIKQVEFLTREKYINISNKIGSEITVNVDSGIIERVFINLLTNSIKYTPQNGNIILESSILADDNIKVTVVDNGEGIPSDRLNSVFDKFQQIDPKKIGKVRSTGLGLTFCKLAIESHGGEIGVNSEMRDGTTFWFTIKRSLKSAALLDMAITEKSDMLELSNEDKAKLLPVVRQFEELEIYEISDLKAVLNQVKPSPGTELSKWKEQMSHAIYSNNDEKYKKLIQI